MKSHRRFLIWEVWISKLFFEGISLVVVDNDKRRGRDQRQGSLTEGYRIGPVEVVGSTRKGWTWEMLQEETTNV